MDEQASPPPARPKLAPKQRELLAMAVEGGLLVALLAGASWAWTQRHVTVDTRTVVVQGSSQPAPSTNASTAPVVPGLAAVSSMETLTVPITSVAPGYALTMQAPTAWRTVDISSLQIDPGYYPNYSTNDLAALLRFVPEHPERSTAESQIEPVNRLDLLATSGWASKSDDVTAATKQSYLAYIGSLKTAADITAKKCTPITMGSSVCVDAKVKPQVVQSADGSLSGLMYMYMQTQSVEYDPSVVIDLVGTVAGKPVRLTGTFQLYDSQYAALATSTDTAKITAARNAFAAGPAADTLAMYNRVVAAVQSVKLAKR